MPALSRQTLEQMCAFLSHQLRLKLIPGDQWLSDRLTRSVMYPSKRLAAMDADEATGYLWRCVSHALNTFGELEAYSVAVDGALEAENVLGVRSIHPLWILNIVLQAERERVEAIARRGARNLENTYLPVRWRLWRESEEPSDRAGLTLPDIQTPAIYWQRVATTIACLAAGVITPEERPTDMPWSEATIATIVGLTALPTYDELLTSIESIIPDLARAQLDALRPPEDQEQNQPDADANNEPDADEDSESKANGDTDNDAASGDDTDAEGEDDTASSSPASEASEDATQGDDDEHSDDNAGSGEDASSDAASGEDGETDSSDGSDQNDEQGDATEDDSSAAGSTPNSNPADESGENNDAGNGGDAKSASGPDGPQDGDSGGDGASGTPGSVDDAPDSAGATSAGGPPAGAPDAPASQGFSLDGIPKELLDAIRDAIEELGNAGITIDFFENDPSADPDELPDYEQPVAGWIRISLENPVTVPTWAAVSQAASAMRDPLRRVFLELAENERGGWERRLPHGRLDYAQVVREKPALQPFRRRSPDDDRRYAFGLTLDRSGSMGGTLEEPLAPEAFGLADGKRWHLTAQLAVALTEAIESLPESTITITVYCTEVELIKPHRALLTTDLRDRIIAGCAPKNANSDAEAIIATVTDLATTDATDRFCFHLTDGEFCSSTAAMKHAMSFARMHDVEIVFLTLECSPASAQRFVPAHLAERVDRDNLTAVVRKHLRRMTAA